MIKLIIAGGRDFNKRSTVLRVLIDWLQARGLSKFDVEIVSGLAKGPDTIGLEIAKSNRIAYKEFPADWKNLEIEGAVIKSNAYGKYNARAGITRNHEMGDYADELLAFWDGMSTGTCDMIEYMKKLGKVVTVIPY